MTEFVLFLFMNFVFAELLCAEWIHHNTAQHLATAQRIAGLVDRAEYKRRQSAPGLKVHPIAFGRDRRMPITNRFS